MPPVRREHDRPGVVAKISSRALVWPLECSEVILLWLQSFYSGQRILNDWVLFAIIHA